MYSPLVCRLPHPVAKVRSFDKAGGLHWSQACKAPSLVCCANTFSPSRTGRGGVGVAASRLPPLAGRRSRQGMRGRFIMQASNFHQHELLRCHAAFASGHWKAFLLPTTRFLDLASPVEASWLSEKRRLGPKKAVSNLYKAGSPRRRRCSCPTAGSADFQARDKASVRARMQRVHSPSNATVSAADPAPSPHLPVHDRVPVRAMAAIIPGATKRCGQNKGEDC